MDEADFSEKVLGLIISVEVILPFSVVSYYWGNESFSGYSTREMQSESPTGVLKK